MARRAAWTALELIDGGAHYEDALLRALSDVTAQGERALCWQLVLGVLRQRSLLDAVIEAASRRTTRNIDPAVLRCLRLGVLEARFFRTPVHAAVDQAVELTRTVKAAHAASFVNAVLRHQAEFTPGADAASGHPAWMIRRWRARWGDATAPWMAANQEPAEVYLVPREDPAGVSRAFQHAGITLLPDRGALKLPPRVGAIPDLPGFTEGRWWVMDPAALAVADLVPDVPEVLDMCAAPGGKSFRLAARGLAVTAADNSAPRLERLRDGAARLGMLADEHGKPGTIHVIQEDWRPESPTLSPGRWPAVLLDAPCSGLGTLRRNPDIRWRRTEAELGARAQLQTSLLRAAAIMVAPGGSIVYAVCSPEPEEGPMVAASLGWPIRAVLDTSPSGAATPGGNDGQDAFWACRMERP